MPATLLLIGAAFLQGASAPAAAEPATAAELLRATMDTLAREPFECLLVLSGRVDGNSYAATGTFAWQDGRHFALRLRGTGLGPDGELPADWQVVADGEKIHLGVDVDAGHVRFSYGMGDQGTLADLVPGADDATLRRIWEDLTRLPIQRLPAEDPGAARRYRGSLDRERYPDLDIEQAELTVDLEPSEPLPRSIALSSLEGDHVRLAIADLRRRSSFPQDRFAFRPLAGEGDAEEQDEPEGGDPSPDG